MESTIRCSHCDQEVDAGEPSCPACGHFHGEPPACSRHPDRLAIGACVVCGDPVCTECNGSEGVHYACPAHQDVPVIEGWAQIYTTSDTVEAELIRDNLQAEGVDTEVLSQKDRSFNVELGDLSPVRVLVPAYSYLDAAGVLAAHMDNQGEVAFACPSCGEAFEPGDQLCSNCGAPLPAAPAA